MRMPVRSVRILVGVLSVLASLAGRVTVAEAFDEVDTHPRLTQVSALQSLLDNTLRTDVGILDGVQARLRGSGGETATVLQWLRIGGASEDFPMCRASNHFHNPLKPFTSSRVTDEPLIDVFCPDFQPVRSNVVWGTGFVSPTERGPATENPFDWDASRRAYWDALTLALPPDREAALARTFETLGHVMHVVQDLAVPAHVRNDFRAHLTNLRPSLHRLTEESVERYVRTHPSIVDNAAATPVDIVGRRVTRFWDTDQYTGANPSPDTAQGLAEYTNANFVSLDTVLTEDLGSRDPYFFPYPRLSSTNAEALFGKDAAVVRFVRAEDGRTDTGLYLDKVRDGETITNFLRAGYLTGDLIDRAPPGTPRRLVLQLDDEVHGSYAAKLVPMALGYSKALLDYFFRGKLDVDLLDAGGGLRLVGTNASTDPLDGGTLAVYADTTDGVRRQASAGLGVGRVESGGTLPAVAVTPPEGAERFVAVYTGTLGEERSAGAFPGGVIGKVLGGYRVEELFADGTRWNLRTPKGIFPLPIPRSDIVDLRWGDADNTLVGRTTFGTTGERNVLRAYKLNRPPGSVGVPLRAAPGGGQEVDVQQTAEATFPFGLDVGGLQLNSTINYHQYLISFVHTTVFSDGRLASERYSDGKAERVVSGSASASFDWRLTLDLAKLNDFRARPYTWQLQQIGVTPDGRMVALVGIRLTQLDASLPASFAVFPSKQFVWCGTGVCSSPPDIRDGPPARVTYGFGRGAQSHWALVDVSQGRVVYSTAAAGVVIDNTIETTQFREFVSGPFNGLVATEIPLRIVDGNPFYPVDAQNNLRLGNSCGMIDESRFYQVDRVGLTFGVTAAAASQYRPELARTEFPPYSERLLFEDKACLAAIFGASPFAFVAVASDEARVYLNEAIGAFRVFDGSERVAFLFDLPQALATNFQGDYARVVAWDPLAQSASLRHEILIGDNRQLITAAHGVAVISGFNNPALTAVPLDGNQPATVFPMPLGEVVNFRAINPAFLFNVQNLKFYRYQPDLVKTALPATLAVGGSATGDYHTIRLP